MKSYHSLAQRQIKKFFPSGNVPLKFRGFIEAVNQAYFEFDLDRRMLERSLEVSSQELFQMNADLRALFDAFPDLFFRIDYEGLILDCRAGKSAESFLSPTKLIGKKIQNASSASFKAKFQLCIREALEMKKTVIFEYETSWNKKIHHYEARMMPFLENQLMVVVRNIDDRKKMEQTILQSEKMSAVGQLAAGVAHEINNPLGVILGFAQGIVKRLQPRDPLEMPLKSIEREALRCKGLVQDLLTFSRTGKSEKEEMDINETIENSISLILAQSKVKNTELIKELEPNLPKVIANKNQLQQVIINLSNNAMDAMPNGGKLTVRTKKTQLNNKDTIEIQVEDTGQGIPKEIQAKIFEPFFTTKEVGKGTGLGLSLVYEIIQKHEGQIKVESEVGKGTKFSFLLPVESQS